MMRVAHRLKDTRGHLPMNLSTLILRGFVKEEVLLHDTPLSRNCTCVACDGIGTNQLSLIPLFAASHESKSVEEIHIRCAYSTSVTQTPFEEKILKLTLFR